jgi:hypothetical protein
MVLGRPLVDPPVVGRAVEAGSIVTVPKAAFESETDRG